MAPRLPWLPAAALLVLAACNDPADRYQPPTAGSNSPPPSPTEDGSAGPPPLPGEAGPAGAAEPGGGPGGGGGCSASQVSLENLPVPEGKGVSISGEITGSGTGPALIEVVRLENNQPVGAYNFICPGVGSFDLTAPPDMGELYFVVFIDEGGDGPSEDDVAGYTGPLTIGTEDVSGLSIAVKADADLGKVALPHQAAWGPPPPADGNEAGAEGGAPPEGTPPEGMAPEGEEPPPDGPPPEGQEAPPTGEGVPPAPEGSAPDPAVGG